MIEVVWDTGFKRSYRKKIRRLPSLQDRFRNQMKLFIDDPFNSRFGTLPDWAKRKLDSASPEQLEQWADCVLKAESIRDILSE